MTPRLFSLTVLAACATLTACSSIKSRIYDSDNYTSPERKIKRLHGIPETVDVPTHVVIRVQETKYYKDTSKDTSSGTTLPKKENVQKESGAVTPPTRETRVEMAGATSEIKEKDKCELIKELDKEIAALRNKINQKKAALSNAEQQAKEGKLPQQAEDIRKEILRLNAELADQTEKREKLTAGNQFQHKCDLTAKKMTYSFVRKKEVFTVDFKRPLSGSIGLTLGYNDLSDGQFLSSATQAVTDTSIADVTALIKAVTQALPTLKGINDTETAKAETAQKAAGYVGITETIAIEYFDIHQPNLEGRIQEFLNRHINDCNPGCCTLEPALPVFQSIDPALLHGPATYVPMVPGR